MPGTFFIYARMVTYPLFFLYSKGNVQLGETQRGLEVFMCSVVKKQGYGEGAPFFLYLLSLLFRCNFSLNFSHQVSAGCPSTSKVAHKKTSIFLLRGFLVLYSLFYMFCPST